MVSMVAIRPSGMLTPSLSSIAMLSSTVSRLSAHNLGFKGDGVGIAVRQRRDDDFFELFEVHDDVLLACDAFIVSKT